MHVKFVRLPFTESTFKVGNSSANADPSDQFFSLKNKSSVTLTALTCSTNFDYKVIKDMVSWTDKQAQGYSARLTKMKTNTQQNLRESMEKRDMRPGGALSICPGSQGHPFSSKGTQKEYTHKRA